MPHGPHSRHWLISKAEAEKWQRFIQGRVQTALRRGSSMALAGTAFLAVYREGVETVLFYQALIGSAGDNLNTVAGGFLRRMTTDHTDFTDPKPCPSGYP